MKFRRLLLANLIGVFLEYFDYTLYGFSSIFIAPLFFPQESGASAFLLTWGVFALGFIVRPLGAFIFGQKGDIQGRRHVLNFNILLTASATLMMGVLPSYTQVGEIAPLLLTFCRILQGLGVSTEYTGCSVYLMEFKGANRGLLSGLTTGISGLGIFAASLLVKACNAGPLAKWIPMEDRWRIPFVLAGFVVGLLGWYLRKNLSETPEFTLFKQQQKIPLKPFFFLFKERPIQLISAILLCAYTGILILLVEVYLPTYLSTTVGISNALALSLSTYIALIEAAFAIGFGWLSNYLGRLRCVFFSAFIMMFTVCPLFFLFHFPSYLYLSILLLALLVAMADGPMAALLVEMFPTGVRYSGTAMSYSLGAAVLGGTAPFIIQLFPSKIGIIPAPAFYMMAAAFITLIVLFSLHQKMICETITQNL